MADRFQNVRRTIAATPWAILPEKLDAILDVVALRARGERLTKAEIRARTGGARPRRDPVRAGAVAVLPLAGVVSQRLTAMTEISGGTSVEQFGRTFDALVADPQVAAIVLDVDSPGGGVHGLEAVASRIYAARGVKPLIAVANSMMASAAYWLASAADEVVVTPTGEAGSIGVLLVHTDVSDAEAQAGVRHEVIRAGRFKAEGLPFEPLSDAARGAMQATVDQVYEMFLAAVARHRGTSAEAVRTGYGEGRALMGRLAVEAGLADRVATLEDVVAELGGRGRPTLLAATATVPALAAALPDGSQLAAATVAAAAPPAPTAPITLVPVVPPAVPSTPPAPAARSITVSEQNTAATEAAPGASANGATALSPEREIAALAEQHALTDRLPKWIGAGTSVNDVKAEIMGELRARLERGPVIRPPVQLSEKEEQQYSFARAILAQDDVRVKCFEREVHDEIAKKLPQGYKPQGGFFVPTNIRAAGLDSGTATKGAELKFVKNGTFIDLLRNRARVLQAGATMLSGLDGPVTFPKQNGAGTASWMGENSGADVAESNLLLTTVSLAAKTLQSTTSFSRQLLRQGVVDVENLVRSDLAAIHALEIDRAALAGSGAANQPTGVFNQAGVGVTAIGANGGAPTYQHVIALKVAVKQANADDLGSMGVITTPGIEGTLQMTQKFAGTNGEAVWSDDNRVGGMPGFSTNQAQSTLVKGTSGAVCHAIYSGIWSQLMIGEWGAMEILTDPYRLKKQGMIEVTSFQMIDIAVRYAAAFQLIKDALSTF